jgi:hypothetical protein
LLDFRQIEQFEYKLELAYRTFWPKDHGVQIKMRKVYLMMSTWVW